MKLSRLFLIPLAVLAMVGVGCGSPTAAPAGNTTTPTVQPPSIQALQDGTDIKSSIDQSNPEDFASSSFADLQP